MWGFPGGYGYQSPGLPPMAPFPTPFPTELGPLGPLAYMGMQQFLPPSLMQMSFTPSTDIWNQFQAIQQFQARASAMANATRGDVGTLMQYQEAIARASGANWSPALEARSRRAAGWVGDMLPVLGMIMPETVDAFMGPRGSQTVMAGQIANASRFMFNYDTGQYGMSGQDAGRLSGRLYEALYGTEASTLSMRGLGAGKAGILMNEMLARGLMSGNPLKDAAGLQASDIADVTGLVGGLGVAGNLGAGTAVSGLGRFRQGAVEQQAEQLRGMAKIISSISDLFGANGQPNAPIPQLLAALDQLGNGMEYRYSPQQVETTFRQLQQATITGRISLPRMSQLITQNSAMLAGMGLDPREAIGLTNQAVNYTTATMDRYQGSFFGKMSPDQLNSAVSQLLVAGESSPAGQMASVALYLSDSTLNPNSEFSQLTKAIRAGETTYGTGKSVLAALQGGKLRSLYTEAGGNGMNFDAAAMNPNVARQFGSEVRMAVRGLQGDEVRAYTGSMMAGTLGQAFGGGGAGLGQALVERVFKSGSEFAKMGVSQQAATLERWAGEIAGQRGLTGSVAGQGRALLSLLDQGLQDFGGVSSLQEGLQVYDPESIARSRQLLRQNETEAGISSALGDLGRLTWTQRLAKEISRMGPGSDIVEITSRVMGGVDRQEIVKALGGKTNMSDIARKVGAGTASEDEISSFRGALGSLNRTMLGKQDFAGALQSQVMMEDVGLDVLKGSLLAGPAGGFAGVISGAAKNKDLGPKLHMVISGNLTMNPDKTASLTGTGKTDNPAPAGTK